MNICQFSPENQNKCEKSEQVKPAMGLQYTAVSLHLITIIYQLLLNYPKTSRNFEKTYTVKLLMIFKSFIDTKFYIKKSIHM